MAQWLGRLFETPQVPGSSPAPPVSVPNLNFCMSPPGPPKPPFVSQILRMFLTYLSDEHVLSQMQWHPNAPMCI